MDHVCYDIRNEVMTRKEAVDFVFKYDGKCSDEYILEFCKYFDINFDEFWKTTEKFRGNIWRHNSDSSFTNKIWLELEKIS